MQTTTVLIENCTNLLLQADLSIVTAESCTAGGLAYALTELAGSSAWFERGFVTYSNAAKTELLQVDSAIISEHGAVSEVVACAMAEGALKNSCADIALSVTGVAGPDGGSADKPVGTVWFAICHARAKQTYLQRFSGDRSDIRQAAIRFILERLIEVLRVDSAFNA